MAKRIKANTNHVADFKANIDQKTFGKLCVYSCFRSIKKRAEEMLRALP
jgi:hypothetical protein